MNTSVDTGGGSHVGGDVSAGGDFVGRDKININLIGDVSAERIEANLPALRALLASRDIELYPEADGERLRLRHPDGGTALLAAEAAKALLPAAARRAEP